MGLGVDVLMAGRTVYVPTSVTLNVFETHLQMEATHTFASMKTDTELFGVDGLSGMVLGTMGFKTSVTKKVSSTVMTTLGGFETTWVGIEEIRAPFLETCAATEFNFTALTSFVVVGFETVGTHVTGAKEPRETGDDIVVAVFMQ